MALNPFFRAAGAWLHRRAENILAALLGILFAAFVVQIAFRYVFNFPIGWTSELSVIAWLWLVLWAAGFVARESEEIRFDLVSGSLRPGAARAMGIVVALAIVALYAAALPASIKYVTFMKVEKTSYLHIRLDYLYSIFVLFLFAVIARYLWILWHLLRGKAAGTSDSTSAGSGL